MSSAGCSSLALHTDDQKESSDDRPACLENPRPKGGILTNGERRFSISGWTKTAAKHPPLKPELTVNFHIRHNYCQHLFMNIDSIDSRYPVRHKLLLAGSGERAAVTLTRVAGYRRSPRGRQRRPIIRSNSHAPDQTILRSQLLQREFDLAAPGPCHLTSTWFSWGLAGRRP